MRRVGSSTLVFAGSASATMAVHGGTLGGQWSVDGFRDPARALFDSPPFPLHPTKRDIGDAYQAITR